MRERSVISSSDIMNTFSYTSRWVARSASSRPQIRCPAFLAGKYNVCAWSASPSRLQESRAAPLDSAGPAVEDATPSSTAGSLDSSGPSEVAGNETSDVATQAATTPGSELAATVDDDAAVLAEVLRPFPSISKPSGKLRPRPADGKVDETVEDIFSDLFDAADRSGSSPSLWDQALGPKGGKIKTPEDGMNTRFPKHFVPSFLGNSSRRPASRDNLAPREQGQFKAIIDQLFATNIQSQPKFRGESPDIAPLRSPADRGHLRKDYLGRAASAAPVTRPIGRLSDVSADVDAHFDELKEEVYRQATDLDVLQWAIRNVFVANNAASAPKGLSFPPTYPLILTFLIDLFRDRFQNPELSLAIFAQARSHSHESYLIGCSTAAYNAMLKTRWDCFLDLAGVEEGVKEMLHHGVGWDQHTTQLISRIVGTLSQEAAAGPSGLGRVMLQHGEDVLNRLAELENEVERYTEAAEARHRSVASQRMQARRADREHASFEQQMARAHY